MTRFQNALMYLEFFQMSHLCNFVTARVTVVNHTMQIM